MPQVINTKILRDGEIVNGSRPSLSALVVCSSETGQDQSAAGLAQIANHVEELVLVVVGQNPIDSAAWRSSLPGDCQKIVCDLSSADYPHLYFEDSSSAYEVGDPLAGEEVRWLPGSSPIVTDWSAVRELCQISCTQDYLVHLRLGQSLANPEHLRGACLLLAEHGRTHAASTTKHLGRSTLETILTNRQSYLRWIDPCREQVEGASLAIIEGTLATTSSDLSRQNLKILYTHCRKRRWLVPDRLLLQLARAADLCGEPSLSSSCVDTILARSRDPEARAFASCLKGETQISAERAAEWYDRSLQEYPTWKAALRLSRNHLLQQKWQECHEYYNLAVSLFDRTTCLLDDSPVDLRSALLFDTAALKEMGLIAEARQNCPLLLETFPSSPSVRELCRSIE